MPAGTEAAETSRALLVIWAGADAPKDFVRDQNVQANMHR